MKHIVLLGDSIFDNKSYVGGGKDTIENLREQMPDDEWLEFVGKRPKD